jgi:hypothetical protein
VCLEFQKAHLDILIFYIYKRDFKRLIFDTNFLIFLEIHPFFSSFNLKFLINFIIKLSSYDSYNFKIKTLFYNLNISLFYLLVFFCILHKIFKINER